MREAWWKSSKINKPNTAIILNHVLTKDFGSRPSPYPFRNQQPKVQQIQSCFQVLLSLNFVR